MNIISIYTERSHKFHFKVISLASTITLFMSWPLKNSHLIVIQQSLCDKMLKWEDFQHGKTLFRSHIIVTYLFTYVSNIPLKKYSENVPFLPDLSSWSNTLLIIFPPQFIFWERCYTSTFYGIKNLCAWSIYYYSGCCC